MLKRLETLMRYLATAGGMRPFGEVVLTMNLDKQGDFHGTLTRNTTAVYGQASGGSPGAVIGAIIERVESALLPPIDPNRRVVRVEIDMNKLPARVPFESPECGAHVEGLVICTLAPNHDYPLHVAHGSAGNVIATTPVHKL